MFFDPAIVATLRLKEKNIKQHDNQNSDLESVNPSFFSLLSNERPARKQAAYKLQTKRQSERMTVMTYIPWSLVKVLHEERVNKALNAARVNASRRAAKLESRFNTTQNLKRQKTAYPLEPQECPSA